MEVLVLYLIGSYVLGVLLQNEVMSNRFILKSRWDDTAFVTLLTLSWVGVLLFILTWNVKPKSCTKWNWLALWPGNWFATDRYIILDAKTLLMMIIGALAIAFASVSCSAQSVYRIYYNDPAHIQCAQVTIVNDTILEAACFDEECFNELATVYSPWCGPYNQIPYGPVSPTFKLLAKYMPTNQETCSWDNNDPILSEIASLPPIETTINNVPVMLEASQMPKIRVYLGDGPIYNFGPNSTEFSTDSRPESFTHLKGLTPQDIMSCLLDHLSITAVIQPKNVTR